MRESSTPRRGTFPNTGPSRVPTPSIGEDSQVDFDYGQFYVLGEGFTTGAARVASDEDIPDPYALTRAEVPVRDPIGFHQVEGTRFYDFVGTTWAVIDLVSNRVLDVLSESGARGWTTYPVEVRDRRGGLVPGLHGLAVTGRCGPIEDHLSPIEVLPPPVPEGAAMPHWMGLRFRPETWDESDVFTPEASAFVFMTKPVRDALVRAKAKNLTLDPLSEVNRLVLDDQTVPWAAQGTFPNTGAGNESRLFGPLPRLFRRGASRRAATARPRRFLRRGHGPYVRHRRPSRRSSEHVPQAIRRAPAGRARPRRRSG
jgi:hypothetical protein